MPYLTTEHGEAIRVETDRQLVVVLAAKLRQKHKELAYLRTLVAPDPASVEHHRHQMQYPYWRLRSLRAAYHTDNNEAWADAEDDHDGFNLTAFGYCLDSPNP